VCVCTCVCVCVRVCAYLKTLPSLHLIPSFTPPFPTSLSTPHTFLPSPLPSLHLTPSFTPPHLPHFTLYTSYLTAPTTPPSFKSTASLSLSHALPSHRLKMAPPLLALIFTVRRVLYLNARRSAEERERARSAADAMPPNTLLTR